MTVFRLAHGAGMPISHTENQISDTSPSGRLTALQRASEPSTGTAHRAYRTQGTGQATPGCDISGTAWEPK